MKLNGNLQPVLLLWGAIWCVMLALTAMTPLANDDYWYMLDTVSLGNVIPVAVKMYMTWNGRFIAEIISRTMVLLPHSIYMICTSAAFMGLMVCICVLVHGSKWKERTDWMQLVLLFGLLWFAVPSFGAVFLWRVGSAHYLWTSLLVMAGMIPFRLLYEQQGYAACSIFKAVLLGLLGYCSGFTNENMGILPFFFALLVLLTRPRGSFSRKYWAVALCIPAGFVTMLAAPGNYVRMHTESEHILRISQMGFWEKLPYWAEKMVMGYGFMAAALLVLVALLLVYKQQRATLALELRRQVVMGCVFVVFALMASGALFFSPNYALRTFTGISLLYILAALCFFSATQAVLPHKKLLATSFSLLLCFSVAYNINIFRHNAQIEQERLSIYAISKNLAATVPPYIKAGKYFFVGSHVRDIENDKGLVRDFIARYYGLRSVAIR